MFRTLLRGWHCGRGWLRRSQSPAKGWSAAGPFLAAVLITPAVLCLPAAPLFIHADTSWSAVLDYARQHRLQFGTDLVFTYGPLGFLIAPYLSEPAMTLQRAASVALCFVVVLGVCLLAWRLRPGWRALLLGVFVVLGANIAPRIDLLLDVGLGCWGLLCFLESGRRLAASLVVFAAFAVFLALAKFSFLILAVLGVGALTADLWLRGRRRLALALVAGVGAAGVLLWILAGQSIAHLGPFLRQGLAVTRAYALAMGLDQLPILGRSGVWVAALTAAAVTVRALTAFARQDPAIRWRRLLLLAWLGSLLFITWKHGFLRLDRFHAGIFLGFAPLLALAIEGVPCERRAARRWARTFGLAACLLAVWTLWGTFFAAGTEPLRRPLAEFRRHLDVLFRPGAELKREREIVEARRHEARLPAARALIGDAGVDVFGVFQWHALANGLNYRPRPVFQNYASADAALMRLNERFYLSRAAPDYVLFRIEAMDHRFPPLEDARVLRHLLINYSLAATEEPFLVLKAASAAPAELALLEERTVRLGERLDLRHYRDLNLWMEIDLDLAWRGRLRRIFYRSPEVRLVAWLDDGQRVFKRVAPIPMLAAGFVASPLLRNNEDVLALYAGDSRTRPLGYSVEVSPVEEHLWHQPVRFRVYQIQNRLGQCPAPPDPKKQSKS